MILSISAFTKGFCAVTVTSSKRRLLSCINSTPRSMTFRSSERVNTFSAGAFPIDCITIIYVPMLFSGVWNFPSISHANSLIGFSDVLAKAILNVAYGTDSFVSESSTWPLTVKEPALSICAYSGSARNSTINKVNNFSPIHASLITKHNIFHS